MQEYLKEVDRIIKNALLEDVGSGDITSNLVIPGFSKGEYEFVSREEIVLCGVNIAEKVFASVDKKLKFKKFYKDSNKLKKGAVIAKISGNVRSILKGERVALNFMQHLSGISTKTNIFVAEVKGTKAKILDTRKTTPGLRNLEKYAVKCGGGKNHRMRLDDMVLIKDNHIEFAGGIKNAILKAKKSNLKIEIECDNIAQVKEAVKAGVDIIMLDNMNIENIKKALEIIGSKALVEASGGVNISNVRKIAQTGVDYISIGALTHSAPSVDIGLDFIKKL